jgi:hypothetical protein
VQDHRSLGADASGDLMIVPPVEDVAAEVDDKAWLNDGDVDDADDNLAHDGPSGSTGSR